MAICDRCSRNCRYVTNRLTTENMLVIEGSALAARPLANGESNGSIRQCIEDCYNQVTLDAAIHVAQETMLCTFMQNSNGAKLFTEYLAGLILFIHNLFFFPNIQT